MSLEDHENGYINANFTDLTMKDLAHCPDLKKYRFKIEYESKVFQCYSMFPVQYTHNNQSYVN